MALKRTLPRALLATYVQHVGYQDIAAVREDAATRKEFRTSQDFEAVLMTEGGGEHWRHCN